MNQTMTDNELIESVAVNVMGWHRNHNLVWHDGKKGFPHFDPITDANDSKLVIEKLRELGYSIEILSKEIVLWSVNIYKGYDLVSGYIGFLGRAVCLAALEAVAHRDQTATNGENIPDITGT